MKKSKDSRNINRRQFLKVSGAASAVVGSVGLGLFGYKAGKDPNSYTGEETFQGTADKYGRHKFAVESPTYEIVGKTERIDARVDNIFSRFPNLMRSWDEEKGIESLDENLQAYYKKHPDTLKEDLYAREVIFPGRRKDNEKYGDQFILAEAWSNAMGAVWPEGLSDPPHVSDFPHPGRSGGMPEPVQLKSPEKTAKLIKQMTYQFGSILTGITRLNPDWVYKYPMRNRGLDPDKPLEVPQHWEYAIVINTPMSWDPLYANPNYGTSFDAYSKSRIVAYRLAEFIKQLGYAARPHTPGTEYDLMVPPIAIDAGLGEQGRHCVLITPELGSNIRPAVVTTNIPMACDKPIDFGVQDFCASCKICAETCPSGAITFGEKTTIRGYKRYELNASKCHNFWYSNLGNIGCRLCVAVCPYTRKSNWMHRTALEVTAHDPTGISHKALTEMQKKFYPGPGAQDYYIPELGGKNESFRDAPWWLKSEDFIDLNG